MTPTPTTAAPDPVRVGRKAVANIYREHGEHGDDPRAIAHILDGGTDSERETIFAIAGARAMQEAMSAQGGGEVRYGPYPVAWMGAGVWAGIPVELPPELYGRQVYVVPVARPAPEVKDAPGEAVFDTCTESECRRCRTPPYARGDMKHSGIGFYPKPTTPAPSAASEGLVSLGHLVTYEDGRRVFFAPGETIKLEGRRGSVAWVTDGKTALARIEADAAEMERKDARIAELERIAAARKHKRDVTSTALNRSHAGIEHWKARATAAEAERDALRRDVKRKDDALVRADQFITNGIAFGFIRMPDASTPDPAHETPEIVRAALRPAKGGRDGE